MLGSYDAYKTACKDVELAIYRSLEARVKGEVDYIATIVTPCPRRQSGLHGVPTLFGKSNI